MISAAFSGASGQTPGNNGGIGGPSAGGGSAGSPGAQNANYCYGGQGNIPMQPCDSCECNSTPANPAGKCLDLGTRVMTSDGNSVEIGSVALGDKILGIDCDGELAEQTVTGIRKFESECMQIEFESGNIVCTPSHAFITKCIDEIFAEHLNVGDTLLKEDGSEVEILGIMEVGVRTVVAIEVEPNHMFIAGTLVHHNKWACALPGYPNW